MNEGPSINQGVQLNPWEICENVKNVPISQIPGTACLSVSMPTFRFEFFRDLCPTLPPINQYNYMSIIIYCLKIFNIGINICFKSPVSVGLICRLEYKSHHENTELFVYITFVSKALKKAFR